MIQQSISSEQFLESRPDLPESGQWAELVQGTVVLFEPPDLDHGTVVLNLSKKLAEYFQPQRPGYACFDLGLLLATSPDTLRFPAVSIFLDGPRFAESDKEFTQTVPVLVVEILSTPDRRQQAAARVVEFLTWGVRCLWQVDTRAKTLTVQRPGSEPVRLDDTQTFTGDPELPGLTIPVGNLFAEPDWYRGTR